MIDNITSKLPSRPKFGPTYQDRRTSITVFSNGAEGSLRKTNTDMAHCTDIFLEPGVAVLPRFVIAGELNFRSYVDYLEGRPKIKGRTKKPTATRNPQTNN